MKLNAYTLIAFYKKLVVEKNSRYATALKAADQAEIAMKKQWCALASIDQIQQYIAAIDAYCLLIEKVNLYNEFEKNCSADLMRKMQDSLRARLSSMKEPDAPIPLIPQAEEPICEIPQVTEQQAAVITSEPQNRKTSAPEIDQGFVSMKQLSSTLRNNLKDLTPPKYVESCRVIDELNLKLLLYIPPSMNKKV